MGACASKPKVKDDVPCGPGPAPISASKELVPEPPNNDPSAEKPPVVNNDPPPPAPKDISVDGDAVGRSDRQGILFKEKVDETKPTESENIESESAKQDGQMLGETEIKLLESAAKTLSENAEQEVSSLKDNMLEGSDQIKKAVEVIKEQVPRQSENRPHESPSDLAQSETESQTKPPESETMKSESSNRPRTAKEKPETKPSGSKTKTASELERDVPADNPSRRSSLVYLDASDKMVIDKEVIEASPEKGQKKLNNGVNPDEKAKKEGSAGTKIQSNGKLTMETEGNKTSETTHSGEGELNLQLRSPGDDMQVIKPDKYGPKSPITKQDYK